MAHLLLADDKPDELERLDRVLRAEGHECARARDGVEAIRRWRADRHDLVILDFDLPGLDAVTATARLKAFARAANAWVPVLVVTGLEDVASRVDAFGAGADGFVGKPIVDEEVRAHVRSCLDALGQQRALWEANRKLLEAQQFREELAQLIVHDLNHPLSAIAANLEFVESRLRGDAEAAEAVAEGRDATARMIRMVTELLDVSRIEEGRFTPRIEPHGARELLDRSRRGRSHEARIRGLSIEVVADPDLSVRLDAALVGRVIDNLLDNSLRYTPRGGTIRLEAGPGPLGARLSVANSGPPIPPADRDRIFQKYVRLSTSRGARAHSRHGSSNRGIGLYFCRLAVESHEGAIHIDDDEGRGARFHIDLPG